MAPKLSKKTLKQLAKLGVKANAVVVTEVQRNLCGRPPKAMRQWFKMFGIKF